MRSITVVMPTYNRRRALEAVWPSYAQSPDVAAIVVVDDGGSDGTGDLVQRLAETAPIPVTLLRHDTKRGAQASKTTGLQAAATEWVLFGEDDVYLREDYCSTLLSDATTTGASAIAGRLVTARIPHGFSRDALHDVAVDNADVIQTPADIMDMSILDADFAARPAGPITVPFLHAVALVKRSVFDSIAFDDTYQGNGWREETDLFLSLVAQGGRVVFSPRTVCYHLRGEISAAGGQRIPRWRVEYYAWRNTLKLVQKHWPLLSKEYGLKGTPFTWTAGFMARREKQQAMRWLNGHRSTFRP